MSDFNAGVLELQKALKDDSIIPAQGTELADNTEAWKVSFDIVARKLANGALPILNKKQQRVPFEPNPNQWQMLYIMHTRIMAGLPCWLGIIKPRQIGCSTLSGAVFHTLTRNTEGMNLLVCAHEHDSLNNISQIYKRFEYQAADEAKKRYDSRKEMYFEEIDSRIVFGVADGNLGVSGTFQGFHASEVCKWRSYAQTVNEGVFPAMPTSPAITLKVFETTGEPNTEFEPVFRQAWEKWVDVKYDPLAMDADDMIPYFAPWFEHPDYTKRLKGALGAAMVKEIRENLTPDEQVVVREMESRNEGRKEWQKINVPERIAWRRSTLRTFNDDQVRFKRSYPETVDDAFSIGDSSIFDNTQLTLSRQGAKEPMRVVEVDLVQSDLSTPRLNDTESGRCRIYEAPVADHEYVIGCDPAMDFGNVGDRGMDGRTIHKSETFSVVLDVTEGCVVACWQGQTNPEIHANHLVAMGIYYNKAMLVPENNAHGHALIARLKELRYRNVFAQTRRIRTMVDEKLGYTQDVKSRARAIDRLQLLFNDGVLYIPDRRLLDQMAVFIEIRGSSRAATKRTTDDGVMALAMAVEVGSRDERGVNRQWSIKDPISLARAQAGWHENKAINKQIRKRWQTPEERELRSAWSGVFCTGETDRW